MRATESDASVLELKKNTDEDVVEWIIRFQVFERVSRSVEFGDPLVNLDVEVDAALHEKAETAATLGITPAQSAHAEGLAADYTLAAANGEIDEADTAQTIPSGPARANQCATGLVA